jgi:hypothetical protein
MPLGRRLVLSLLLRALLILDGRLRLALEAGNRGGRCERVRLGVECRRGTDRARRCTGDLGATSLGGLLQGRTEGADVFFGRETWSDLNFFADPAMSAVKRVTTMRYETVCKVPHPA